MCQKMSRGFGGIICDQFCLNLCLGTLHFARIESLSKSKDPEKFMHTYRGHHPTCIHFKTHFAVVRIVKGKEDFPVPPFFKTSQEAEKYKPKVEQRFDPGKLSNFVVQELIDESDFVNWKMGTKRKQLSIYISQKEIDTLDDLRGKTTRSSYMRLLLKNRWDIKNNL